MQTHYDVSVTVLQSRFSPQQLFPPKTCYNVVGGLLFRSIFPHSKVSSSHVLVRLYINHQWKPRQNFEINVCTPQSCIYLHSSVRFEFHSFQTMLKIEHTYTFREIVLPVSCMARAHTERSPASDSFPTYLKSTALQFNWKVENFFTATCIGQSEFPVS